MTQLLRRVPAATDPEGLAYYEGERVAIKKSDDDLLRNKFKGWFVGHCAEYASAADPWDSSEWKAYLNSGNTAYQQT